MGAYLEDNFASDPAADLFEVMRRRPSPRPWNRRSAPGNCFNNSAQRMIATGTKYITEVVTQNPSDVERYPVGT